LFRLSDQHAYRELFRGGDLARRKREFLGGFRIAHHRALEQSPRRCRIERYDRGGTAAISDGGGAAARRTLPVAVKAFSKRARVVTATASGSAPSCSIRAEWRQGWRGSALAPSGNPVTQR